MQSTARYTPCVWPEQPGIRHPQTKYKFVSRAFFCSSRIEKKLTAGLTSGLDGFLTSYGQLIAKANTWLAGQMGVSDITKNKKFTNFMTKTKDNTVNIMVGMLKRFLTPSNQNLDGLMSDLKLSDSGEIDNWFMTFGAKCV